MNKPILRGKVSLCRSCGKVFTTTSTFDKHRVGKYPERRCLTTEEMDTAGWGLNRHGRWFRAWMGTPRAYVIRREAILKIRTDVPRVGCDDSAITCASGTP